MMNGGKVVNDGLGSLLKAEQRSLIQGHLQAPLKPFAARDACIVHLSVSPPQDSFLASIFVPFKRARTLHHWQGSSAIFSHKELHHDHCILSREINALSARKNIYNAKY